MTRIDITGETWLQFEWRTDKFGRAEFIMCPQYKRGKLVRMTIYPAGKDYYYVWEGKVNGFCFGGYHGLDYPSPWMFDWCKEHRCNSFRLYVPTHSNWLWLSVTLGLLNIGFCKTNWNETKIPSRSVQGINN